MSKTQVISFARDDNVIYLRVTVRHVPVAVRNWYVKDDILFGDVNIGAVLYLDADHRRFEFRRVAAPSTVAEWAANGVVPKRGMVWRNGPVWTAKAEPMFELGMEFAGERGNGATETVNTKLAPGPWRWSSLVASAGGETAAAKLKLPQNKVVWQPVYTLNEQDRFFAARG